MTTATGGALLLGGLHCTLGQRQILKGLDAAPLHSGRLTAVLGRNGVGKSTLLRSIAGFIPCTAERMHLGGLDLRPLGAAARAATLRYLPQSAPGGLHLTVYDCLLVALNAHHRHPSPEARRRIDEMASGLGLEPMLNRYLDELSGGQKQLVWLAQALIHRPRILLLDEPLAALDPNYQHHVMKLLRRLAAEQDLIVLVVLHDLNMAMRYADQAMVLHDGRVIAQGPVRQALDPGILAQAFLVAARVEHCSRGTPLIVIDDLLKL
ncbi:ABC transporter ATP-binding protein [Alcaligenaceae bacterium]|nr:ABC transporter ATP-binding protein [Alcaligenaceae bacterium]